MSIGFGPITRHHIFSFGAVYAKTAPPKKPGIGWFDEWPAPYPKPPHSPGDIKAIMGLQKSGKTGGKPSAREEHERLLAQEQEDITNEWYEAHLRALLNRRRKKKK